MKKSCLVALGALVACIGAANAASLKDTCLANPSKFVWVEKNQDCAPINPCSQPEGSHYYKLYCNDMWSDGGYFSVTDDRDELLSDEQAKAQADWYIKHILKDSSGCIEVRQFPYVVPADIKKQYVKCKTGKGDYMEFKMATKRFDFSINVARCEAMGKVFRDTRGEGGVCEGVTKEECAILAEGMEKFAYPACPQIFYWTEPYVDWEGEMAGGICAFPGCI